MSAFPGTPSAKLGQIATDLLAHGSIMSVTVGAAAPGTNGGQSFVGTPSAPGYHDQASGKGVLDIELGGETAKDAARGEGVGVMILIHEYAHSVLGIRAEYQANQLAIAMLPFVLTKYFHQSVAQAMQGQKDAIYYVKHHQPPAYQTPSNFSPTHDSAATYAG